jgi:phage terminase small subunit
MPTPPKPTALKILDGTARADRVNPNEPKPALGARPPSWLPRTGVAWSTWRKHTRVLGKVRVLTEADADALAAGCMALDEAITGTKSGADWHKVDAAWRRYWQCLQHFGMTPASRTKISAAPDGEVDPLEAWRRDRAAK